jgi:hypothetical protein
MDKKILVNDNNFTECVNEIATQITETYFGLETWEIEDGHRSFTFTDEAQSFYNDSFSEIESLINNTLNVWNKKSEL